MFTYQDRMSGPEAVSYTEFKAEVTNKNVKEVFARGDTIQGALKKAAPLPDQQDRTYDRFTTERPTFATDDLLAELTGGGSHRPGQAARAGTRGLDEFAVLDRAAVIAVRVLLLDVPAPAKRDGRRDSRRARRKPVDPETVRVTFEDVAGIDEVEAEINEVVDFLRDPAKYRRLGARAPKGVLLDRGARDRQNTAGPGDRR